MKCMIIDESEGDHAICDTDESQVLEFIEQNFTDTPVHNLRVYELGRELKLNMTFVPIEEES